MYNYIMIWNQNPFHSTISFNRGNLVCIVNKLKYKI
jgi:hypothetical protein